MIGSILHQLLAGSEESGKRCTVTSGKEFV